MVKFNASSMDFHTVNFLKSISIQDGIIFNYAKSEKYISICVITLT
ncbi:MULTISPECIES: hypothetical protein [Clostridium]|nr:MULTISPECIES: hypothetical protein [Clostridium]